MKETKSINPFTGLEIKSYRNHTNEEVRHILDKAENRFQKWRQESWENRKNLMCAAASELRTNKEHYALTMVEEMGKPISQAISEIEKCAWVCEYYAAKAEEFLQDEIIETDAHQSFVRHEPLGVILAVMPWNFPYWQVFRFAAPALMAGNVVVLKHASNVFGCALNIEEIFRKAEFPENCLSTLLVGHKEVENIIINKHVKAVTLTGSGPAGGSVASIAGKHIKKTLLELGGNNALIVFKDCDLEKTIETCINARFQNAGQSCIAGKRLLIDEEIQAVFIEKMTDRIKELSIGDPKDKDTFMASLAREDLAKDLEEQVERSLKMGARLVIGGKRNKAFFEPTVLTGVTPEMPVFKEETFGPVLAVTSFKTIDEAIALSNNSNFGLGVSIFTSDIEAAKELIPHFAEGAVFINDLVKSDPRLPFGGVKESGYGRELSRNGIQEFTNKKTIYINI